MPVDMVKKPALGTPPSLATLREGGAVSLFLDFDGTLVNIAPTPEAIDVPVTLGAGLEALSSLLDGRLALVTGRALSDIAVYLGHRSIAQAGSHGAERVRVDGTAIGQEANALPEEAEAAVRAFAAEHDGVRFEEKAHGAALHFRAAQDMEAQAVAFMEALATSHDLAVKRGKCVAELVHRGADKAGAVFAFMKEAPFVGSIPIFIGDDVTDEDGIRAAIQLGGFGIIVGDRPDTRAQYRLAAPASVHEWLGL